MHLAICTVGTALAVVGHFPRVLLWLPHVVGLGVMLAVAHSDGAMTVRALGLVLMTVLACVALTGLADVRDRVESIADATAMIVLIAVVPTMPDHHMAHLAGPSAPDSTLMALTVATLLAWASVRVWAWRRMRTSPASGASSGTSTGRMSVAGSVLMVAGMSSMVL